MSASKLGTPKSQEFKDNVSQTKLSKSTPVIQYDKNNNFIQEFPSQKSALEYLNKNINASGISGCICGRSKSAFGFIWKYKI
jgi:hypothetical protein